MVRPSRKQKQRNPVMTSMQFSFRADSRLEKSGEWASSLSLQHEVYVPCIALTGLSFRSENDTCGCAGPTHLTVSPPKSTHPLLLWASPRPPQCLARSRCTISVRGSPGPQASQSTSRLLALSKVGHFLVAAKTWPCMGQQRQRFQKVERDGDSVLAG